MRTKWLWLVPLTSLLLILVAAVVVVSASPISDRWSDRPRLGQTPPADNSILLRTTPGAIVPTNDWPDACQLIGERDVLAILPDATEVDSMPGGASTMTIEEYAADPRWREEEGTTEGSCVWDMKLPGEQPNWYTTVWVRIIAVADPALIGKYHEDQGTYRGAGVQGREYPGGGSCYLSSLLAAHLVCARGPLMFEVGGSSTTDFGDFRAYSYWRDEVLPRFAGAVMGHLRST